MSGQLPMPRVNYVGTVDAQSSLPWIALARTVRPATGIVVQ